jgi:hypothetical protein
MFGMHKILIKPNTFSIFHKTFFNFCNFFLKKNHKLIFKFKLLLLKSWIIAGKPSKFNLLGLFILFFLGIGN